MSVPVRKSPEIPGLNFSSVLHRFHLRSQQELQDMPRLWHSAVPGSAVTLLPDSTCSLESYPGQEAGIPGHSFRNINIHIISVESPQDLNSRISLIPQRLTSPLGHPSTAYCTAPVSRHNTESGSAAAHPVWKDNFQTISSTIRSILSKIFLP